MNADRHITLVIFGALGDLSRRKLMPALFSLHRKGRLPEWIRMVGFGLPADTDDAFREAMRRRVYELSETCAFGLCKRPCLATDGMADVSA